MAAQENTAVLQSDSQTVSMICIDEEEDEDAEDGDGCGCCDNSHKEYINTLSSLMKIRMGWETCSATISNRHFIVLVSKKVIGRCILVMQSLSQAIKLITRCSTSLLLVKTSKRF